MLSQYYIWNLCWRRFAIEGEGLPWGSSAMGFLPGEGVPYGIPSWGTFAMWHNFREEICHGICPLIMQFAWGELYHMVLFPPGEVLPCDFRGKVCHMVFLHGERLPCGIISGRKSAMVFVPSSCNLRGGSFTIWYCFPLGKFCHVISGGRFAIWYSFRGKFAICYAFQGGGGGIIPM